MTGMFVPTALVLSERLQDTTAAAGAEGPSGSPCQQDCVVFSWCTVILI